MVNDDVSNESNLCLRNSAARSWQGMLIQMLEGERRALNSG
jgi:hypothetical protein